MGNNESCEIEVTIEGKKQKIEVSEEAYIQIMKERKQAERSKRAFFTCFAFGMVSFLLLLVITTLSACGINKTSYKSETTGMEIPNELSGQRPVAVLTEQDNIEADILYEFASASGTSKLAVIKDWGDIQGMACAGEGFDTARQIIPEWNALFITDRAQEETEIPYIDTLDMDTADGSGISSLVGLENVSTEYNEYRINNGFEYDKKMPKSSGSVSCKEVKAGDAVFTYDDKKKTYSSPSAGEFSNIILQDAIYLYMEEKPYFNLCDTNRDAWLIRNGIAIPLTWTKLNDMSGTGFYDNDGNKASLAPGKTYIGIISDQDWGNIDLR